jgi:hypothetical protein
MIAKQYLLLRQSSNCPAEVISSKNGIERILFSGKRWPARRFFEAARVSETYKNVTHYVRKETAAWVDARTNETIYREKSFKKQK